VYDVQYMYEEKKKLENHKSTERNRAQAKIADKYSIGIWEPDAVRP